MSNPPTFPRLIDILPVERIPQNNDFVEGILEMILSDIHYKDFTSFGSKSGDTGSYTLKLIFQQSVGVKIGGTDGMRLLLNPGASNANITEVYTLLNYRLNALKYKGLIDCNSFRADPFSYMEAFLALFGIPLIDLFKESVSRFENGDISLLINRFNAKNPNSPLVLNSGVFLDVFEDIAYQIANPATNNVNLLQLIYDEYLALSDIGDTFSRIKIVFSTWLGKFSFEDFLKLFIPKFDLAVEKINLAIEFPRSVLIPVATSSYNPTANSQSVVPEGEALPNPYKTLLRFEVGALKLSTEDSFEFVGEQNFTFQKSFILGTKFTLELHDMKLDLSRTKNIPEAIADGRPADFIGVYIKDGTVGFPAEWGHNEAGSTGELYVNNLLAGTGGLSGTIGLRGNIITPATSNSPAIRETNPLISVKFGEKFSVSLDTFSIKFQQNAIIGSDIQGTLTIPDLKDAKGDDVEIKIKIHFGQNGDFFVNAEEKAGIELHLSDFLTISVKSMRLEKRSGKFFFAVSGSVGFGDVGGFIGDFLPKKIDIDKLLIWQNGQIELEGGVVTLAQPVKLNLGPVKLTVTALGMGSHERMHKGQLRKYKYVEFSAGISVNPGGVDARGDGIQVFFTVDQKELDVYVRIQSIAIDLIIPGSASKDDATLLLSGYLSMKEPKDADSDAGTEYAGGIDFKLPKLKMGGSADMRYNPKVPSFLIDVSLEISTPIILGATGMGIYGFRALFGKRYIVSKTEIGLTEEAEWWQYYKKKVPPKPREGITASKMANKPGFSFGAGLSLATATDGGKAFSSKLFFLLSLPDVFLLQGQAQILKGRIGLDSNTDPPFFALIAIDKTSISAALGVNYKIPEETGKIMALDALIEMAYFWRDSSAWYLNIGRDQPVDRRVRARIFDLFDVYSYFMLNARGIRAGAGASLEQSYNYGPVKARLYAYMDTAGRLSFKPLQIGGSIQIGGGVDIKVCGMGLSVIASASLAAEAPKPFIITGRADACVKVLKKEYCAHFEFTWVYGHDLDFSQVPVVTAGLISEGGGPSVNRNLQTAVKALNMMSQEPLDLLCIDNIPLSLATAGTIPPISDPVWHDIDQYVIPMDSFIDIEFRKPVKPFGDISLQRFGGATSGADYTDYVAPQRGKSDRVRHDYVLNKVEVFSWNPTANLWSPYHVYEAISPLKQDPFNLTPSEVDQLHFGFWQIDNPGKYTKLRLLAQNPLSFLRQGTGDTVPEDLGVTNGIFCAPPERLKTCVNFDSLGVIQGRTMEVAGNKILQHQRLLARIINKEGTLLYKPFGGVNSALSFKGGNTLELYLPEPMAEVSLLLGTLANALTIKYYVRKQTGTNSSNMPVFGYDPVRTEVKTPAELPGGVRYSDLNRPIDKIEITGILPDMIDREHVFCDTNMSTELQDFLKLMNLILKRGALIDEVDLTQEPYRSLLMTLSIFPQPIQEGLSYSPSLNGNVLTITFKSGIDFVCLVVLSGLPENWSMIEQFKNPRPDPAQTALVGANKHFLAEVSFIDGMSDIVISGRSDCISAYYCYNEYLNFFYQICWLNTVDFQYNQNLPTVSMVNQHNQSMADAINKALCPVWRPDTVFAVRVEYTDEVYQESTPQPGFNRAFVFGFKTQGPLGHYHEFPTGDGTSDKLESYSELEAADKEDTFKLSALKYYIDFPKSYPDPSGNIINAKPLYYQDPELRLFYIFPHVYQFYKDWDGYNGAPKVESSLEVLIKDPAEIPLVEDPQDPTQMIPNPGLPAEIKWEANEVPIITPDIAALNNMIVNGSILQDPCLPSQTPLRPNGINNVVKPAANAPLEPLKLYTAIYKAVYNPAALSLSEPVKQEIHRYGFQTSRYKGFKEHINSYILQQNGDTNAIEKAAVYVLKKPFDPKAITRARQVIAGKLPANDPLHTEAALIYDKLVDRLFEIKELEPAECLQFNLIRDTNTGAVLGIMLRSPEPFNDPRTPDKELANTLLVGVRAFRKTNWNYYDIYFSKDNSSAFITKKRTLGVSFPAKHFFQFKYLLYNGKDYEEKDSEEVTLDFGPYLMK